MPSLNFQIGPSGPVVELFLGVSTARMKALHDAGQAMPQWQKVRLLVDTGASGTNICSSVISQLGILPTGQVPVFTPSTGSTPVPMDLYDVNLVFMFSNGAPAHVVETVPILSADFKAQGIDGLLGRDILSRASLIYHGDMKLCTLNF